jgi:DNA polymerase-3 subunit alpha
LGYLKIDVLGLRALQTVADTLVDLGHDPNDRDWIPLDDPKTLLMLRDGHSDGVFQYEGWSSRKGAMEMKVNSTRDLIFGLALYRPALMNGGQKDLYLRNRKLPFAKQDRLHKLFDQVVVDTEGVPLYQEQITEILKAVGMGFTDYNDLMGAIKASNGSIHGAASTFKRLRPEFYDLCEAKGLSDADSDKAWGAIIGFTEYGFNRAHSTSYGLLSYHSAYLKAHHPTEYLKNLLTVWSDNQDKMMIYQQECRRLGITVIRADVNESGAGWTIDKLRPNALRKGLRTVAGVGDKAVDVILTEREANGAFVSITDFIARVPARPVTGGKGWAKGGVGGLVGVCKSLHSKHAFRSCDQS